MRSADRGSTFLPVGNSEWDYPVWDRAIRDGGVTKAVLRLPHEKEETRVVFARRKDPPPAGAREVLLAVRWEWVHVGPLPWPTGTLTDRSALGFRVETATERVGRFMDSSPPDDLRLAARAADKVRAGIAEAGASGDPVRVVLLFHSDTPVRQVLALLSALDRAGVGEVEIAETRPR